MHPSQAATANTSLSRSPSDAFREVQKYSGPEPMQDAKVNPNVYDHVHMKLFRAQRNLYISGFSLFLWLLVLFLSTLIHRRTESTGTTNTTFHTQKVHLLFHPFAVYSLSSHLVLSCFHFLPLPLPSWPVNSSQYHASGCHLAKPGCGHTGEQCRPSGTDGQCSQSSQAAPGRQPNAQTSEE